MRKMAKVLVIVSAAAVMAVAFVPQTADALRISFGPGGITIGVSAPGTGMVTTSGGDVLCCWVCPKDGRQRCGYTSDSFCFRWGDEVESCSECQQ